MNRTVNRVKKKPSFPVIQTDLLDRLAQQADKLEDRAHPRRSENDRRMAA